MHLPPERLNADPRRAFPRSRILVIGDLMLDEFLWGKVTRISPEAPVPVVDMQRRAAYPGGAANVARNLASLGARRGLAGVIGDDEPGRHLVAYPRQTRRSPPAACARRRAADDAQDAHLRDHAPAA